MVGTLVRRVGYAALAAGSIAAGAADADAQSCFRPRGNERHVTRGQIAAQGSIACNEWVITDGGATGVNGACNRERVPLGSRYDGSETRPQARNFRIERPVCGR